ncbi:MAG: cyclodeaminase/cyclohydrolase family protein, partial [Eubacterium sp.]|nr:cyclodeaminase/cyclohydrolase family protein [Eubacterium sp.]
MSDKLTDRSCADFAEALASKAPVPGGGGAAALTGALSAALCSMVGNFTTGKKKYAAYEEDIQRILEKAGALRLQLLELIDADAAAFEPLSRAYAIPKDDPHRSGQLEKATLDACRAPIEMVKCCGEIVPLLEELAEKGSVLLVSDVGCGALLCAAAMEAAAMNVFINTGTLQDRQEALRMEEEVNGILASCLPRARAAAD